jgi:hypothetical protein
MSVVGDDGEHGPVGVEQRGALTHAERGHHDERDQRR